MAEPTGYQATENEGKDNERRVFQVRVFDRSTSSWQDCYDVYDQHNIFIEHIGYSAGDDRQPDRVVNLTPVQQRYINRILKLMA